MRPNGLLKIFKLYDAEQEWETGKGEEETSIKRHQIRATYVDLLWLSFYEGLRPQVVMIMPLPPMIILNRYLRIAVIFTFLERICPSNNL